MSKLTNKDIENLRADYIEGVKLYVIQHKYGLSYYEVKALCYGLDSSKRVDSGRLPVKITPDIKADIIKRAKDGESLTALAAEYGVSRQLCHRISKGISYYKKIKPAVSDWLHIREDFLAGLTPAELASKYRRSLPYIKAQIQGVKITER